MDEIVLGVPPLHQAAEKIVSLKDRQFEILQEEVTGAAGFARSIDRCDRLANKLSLSRHDIFNILTTLQFFYDSARKWEKAGRDGSNALNEFFQFTGLNQSLGKSENLFYGRVKQLVAINPVVERRRKIRKLKSGLVDTAVDFASFLDLRPFISDDRTIVEKLVPVVIFRVAIKAEYGSDKSCVFQMSPEGVAKLRDAVTDIERKLATVSADDTLRSLLELSEERDESDE